MVQKIVGVAVFVVFGLTSVAGAAGVGWMKDGAVSPPFVAGVTVADFNAGWNAGGFDVLANGQVVTQMGADARLYDADGTFIRTIATRPDATGYGSFVRVDPTGTTVYFGKTGGDGDYIYAAALSDVNGTASEVAELTGNFDMEFAQVSSVWTPFATGLHTGISTGVWLVDLTGADQHDLITEIGGYSSGLAFDSNGRLLVGSYNSGTVSDGIVAYDAVDWQAWIGPANDVADASDLLTLTEASVYDIAVDDADNVAFNMNGASSSVAWIEDGKDYSGYGGFDYDFAFAEANHWLTQADATGDLSVKGKIYTGDFYNSEVGTVETPEPASILLVSAAGVLLGVARRRK